MDSLFNIVLFEPEIPQNTGSIGRMCVSTDTKLHLIKPLGYELSDKYLKRAGMDYWQYLDLTIYENWEDFLNKNPDAVLYFFSTKAPKTNEPVLSYSNIVPDGRDTKPWCSK